MTTHTDHRFDFSARHRGVLSMAGSTFQLGIHESIRRRRTRQLRNNGWRSPYGKHFHSVYDKRASSGRTKCGRSACDTSHGEAIGRGATPSTYRRANRIVVSILTDSMCFIVSSWNLTSKPGRSSATRSSTATPSPRNLVWHDAYEEDEPEDSEPPTSAPPRPDSSPQRGTAHRRCPSSPKPFSLKPPYPAVPRAS